MKRILSKYIISIVTAVSGLFVISCEKEIDIDLRSVEPHLVIEGKVIQDSLAMVKLTNTKDFDENNEYIPLTGANILISDDAGNSETLVMSSSGWYIAPTLKGVVGRTYNLSVSYDGKEYTSTSKMPPMVPIDSITMFHIPTMDYDIPRLHFKDPLGTTNDYYRKKIYINGKYISLEYEAISADRIDGTVIVDLSFIPENKLENDEIKKGDKIMIELQSIDKGAFTFFDTLGNIENSLNNPTSNIEGGALGYFSAFTFDRKEIEANW